MFSCFVKRKICFRLLASMLLALSPFVTAHPPLTSARQQINIAVVEEAGKAITALAARAGWHDYRYTLNVFMPGNVAELPLCGQQLRLSSTPLQAKNLARQNYRVTCGGGAPWQAIVTVKADVYLPIAMAIKEIARGETLTPDALVMKKFNISNLRGEPLLDRDEATGMTVKRTLRARTPILRAQLQLPLLVKRGQTVTISSATEGIQAQTAGVALKDGRLHESIKVQNSSSERVIDATVTAAGRVSIGPQ